ncbi:hypothetical protein [Flavobacterium sp. '19STA2R22 D10 B1']|uniref:hypothetical protein n=1 Tax=Flavobacterium aerium TaxID=3037261 RepID=UPI00278C038B|nr:hypothetical protein [Flavobacterium sp. '19STA2R22 D10 B1']
MTTDEKNQELEIIIDNLIVQSGLSIAKQGAMMQMVLGIYRETFDKEKYNLIVTQFIKLWEKYCLDTLEGLEQMNVNSDLILRQKEDVKSNISLMRKELLS